MTKVQVLLPVLFIPFHLSECLTNLRRSFITNYVKELSLPGYPPPRGEGEEEESDNHCKEFSKSFAIALCSKVSAVYG